MKAKEAHERATKALQSATGKVDAFTKSMRKAEKAAEQCSRALSRVTKSMSPVRRTVRKPKWPRLSASEQRLFKQLQQTPGAVFPKGSRQQRIAIRLQDKGRLMDRSGHWYPNFYGKEPR